MPSSDFGQISPIVELMVLCQPESILDVGCGFGKYGVLAREYLELWDGRERYGDWTRRIDCIEAFEPYVTPLHRFIYDHVHVGEAREIIPNLEHRYRLVLLIDVLEHMSIDDGLKVLGLSIARSRNVLIATPKVAGEQGPAFGNPRETHASQWKPEHFNDLPNAFFVPHPCSLIVFAGEDARRVWKGRLAARLARGAGGERSDGPPRDIGDP